MRPKPSDRQRERWRKYPLTAMGIFPGKREQARIAALLDAGDVAGAQRIILDFLTLAIDGPSFRVVMRNGRKRLVPR